MQPLASIAQLVEHALRKRMVVGSIPTGGFAKLCCERSADSESLLTLGVYDKPRGDGAAIKKSTATR